MDSPTAIRREYAARQREYNIDVVMAKDVDRNKHIAEPLDMGKLGTIMTNWL